MKTIYLIALISILSFTNSFSQVSVGVDLMSRKEFLKYTDPGNRILPDQSSQFAYGAFINVQLENNYFIEGGFYSYTYSKNIQLYYPNRTYYLRNLSNPNRFFTIPIKIGYAFSFPESGIKLLRRTTFSPVLGTAMTFIRDEVSGQIISNDYTQTHYFTKRKNYYLEGGFRLNYEFSRKIGMMFNYSWVKGFRKVAERDVEYTDLNFNPVNATISSDGSARHWSVGLLYRLN